MGESTPTPAETGEELIQLISETAETTGLSVQHIANTIIHVTGINFEIRDGRLNITEEALRAMDWKMAYARAECRELRLSHEAIESVRASSSVNDSISIEAAKAGYFIPTAAEEDKIRQKYYKSRGHHSELSHSIWNDLRLVTGTNMYSQNEVANFIHGASIQEIFGHRCQLTGNIRGTTEGIPSRMKATTPRITAKQKQEEEPVNLLEAIFSIPWYAWVGGFVFVLWLLAATSPNRGNTGGLERRALERAEQKARSGRATEMTNAEADAFRKKQEADSIAHRKAVLGK